MADCNDLASLRVTREVKAKGQFHMSYDLRDFPFDRQEFSVHLVPAFKFSASLNSEEVAVNS